ncbi:ribonuclease BN [Brevirhabdus pacifica]|uniref:Ribonuclease BN n=2 Tax=Brevirhabdus pacifica TaxID=1267768 RepID=A0A1U7DEL0_9RHOB|nr:YihY/virulence factor BrkB family protein [Brevirhabdus pacifica]APX88401.1 ribonuclease BN [Brevirhabdus pacifica]OWU79714.1 ribonuclease BN [Loktanella sp. 22II-4b]PJJ87141.1 membrane protein [Brevirhabdus pacifica]
MARGRNARSPWQIPPAGWKDTLFRIKDEIGEDHVGLIAAGVAFYGLLALFPGITACMAIAGLLTEPTTIVDQLDRIGQLLPPEAASIIITQARDVAGSQEGGLGLAAVLGIALAIWSASKGVGSLIEGLNVAYDESEKRGFVKLKLVTLGLTVMLVFGLLVGLSTSLVVPAILSAIGLGAMVEFLLGGLTWVVMFALTIFGLAVFYRYGPSRDKPEWRWVTPGAAVACVLWLIGSAGFAWYVANFGSYNETFGTLGGAIILLMWLWLSAYIVLLGAELDAELEAQTRYDTTTGPSEPMGQRGAEKADNLGEASD